MVSWRGQQRIRRRGHRGAAGGRGEVEEFKSVKVQRAPVERRTPSLYCGWRLALRRKKGSDGAGWRILDGDGAAENGIGLDQIAGGGSGFENGDGGLGDGVVADDVVVAIEEDAGFGSTKDGVVASLIRIALEANAIEYGAGGGLIAGEIGGIGVDKDAHLADSDGAIGDSYPVGLGNENIGGDGGAGGDGSAGRPKVIGDGVAVN